MTSYSFIAYGNANIRATHKRTLEITKDNFLTKNGDCIIGIIASFEPKKLMEFVKNALVYVEIELKVNNITERIRGIVNKNFSDERAIVIRKSNFISGRTLIFSAEKSAFEISRHLVELAKSPNQKIYVCLRAI
ncbi:MAG: DUF371 domain-containing protein [Nanoarchaeota archaeon]